MELVKALHGFAVASLSNSHCLPSIQVDYSVTPEDLQEHFEPAGSVEKITIPTDKFKNPKG
jgi:RNA recognition motif-containing protein